MLESPASCFAFRYGAPLNMTARLSVVFRRRLISARLSCFSEGTVRRGRRDSAHPDQADRTFFFGNTNRRCLSGSTLRLAGYLRRVRLGRRQSFPPAAF